MPETYLVTPVVVDAAAFAPLLRATVERTGAVSVLLRLVPGDPRETVNRIKALAPVAQALGAAVLIEGDPALAARGGADGVHVAGADSMRAALESLKPDRIVGAGDLRSRHDSMEAGEAGVDYVMFGEPWLDDSGAEALPPFAAALAQAEWWAQIFETPCVIYAPSAEAAAEAKRCGAEFVALGPWAFAGPV
jgi:thiamine-phosphate pyrophosphorylase